MLKKTCFFLFFPPALIRGRVITLGSVSYKKSRTPQTQHAAGFRAGKT